MNHPIIFFPISMIYQGTNMEFHSVSNEYRNYKKNQLSVSIPLHIWPNDQATLSEALQVYLQLFQWGGTRHLKGWW